MRKISILRRKVIRSYKKKSNWEYSLYKGYPEGTYFGYESLNQYIHSTFTNFKQYYGPTLRRWRY